MKKAHKKPLVFIACLLPLFIMVYNVWMQQLGAEPIIGMLKTTGIWALRFLVITLAISPIRRLFSINLLSYRRMLGLFVMFYATLHLLIYVTFEFGFDFATIAEDILRRKFILVGMLAFVLLTVLTVTSTNGMMKRLGKQWLRLHKSIYWIAGLATLHFLWLVKSDYTEPALYAGIFIVLFALRLPKLKRNR